MMESPRKRIKTPDSQLSKSLLFEKPPFSEKQEMWSKMMSWLNGKLGNNDSVTLQDSDTPFLQAILNRGSVQVLDRADIEGKHMDLENSKGFSVWLKQHPKAILAIRESILEHCMRSFTLDPAFIRVHIQTSDAGPRIVVTAQAKVLGNLNPHYSKMIEGMPDVIGSTNETAVRLVVSVNDIERNTIVSFHPRTDSGMQAPN